MSGEEQFLAVEPEVVEEGDESEEEILEPVTAAEFASYKQQRAELYGEEVPVAIEEENVESGMMEDEPIEEVDEEEENSTPAYGVVFHESFQPGSTPMVDGHQLLGCNTLGHVRLQHEEGRASVAIEFMDAVRYKPIRIVDRHNLTMAAIGQRGALLASRGEENDGGTVLYKALEGWGLDSTDWQIHYETEYIEGVAIGTRWATVFTNLYMRIMTYTGLEVAVLSLPDRFVTAAGSGNFLGVICDAGNYILKCDIYDVEKKIAIHRQIPVAISRGDRLIWAGWTDEGLFSTCDSTGVIRVLCFDFGLQWVPVYDPSSQPDKKFYPMGLTEDTLYGVPCPGTDHPPLESSKLKSITIPLRIPVAPTPMGSLREKYIRASVANETLKRDSKFYTDIIGKSDLALDKLVLEMFKLALKEEQTARALDLVSTINKRTSFEEALKYAHYQKQTTLLEQMKAVQERLFGQSKLWACDLLPVGVTTSTFTTKQSAPLPTPPPPRSSETTNETLTPDITPAERFAPPPPPAPVTPPSTPSPTPPPNSITPSPESQTPPSSPSTPARMTTVGRVYRPTGKAPGYSPPPIIPMVKTTPPPPPIHPTVRSTPPKNPPPTPSVGKKSPPPKTPAPKTVAPPVTGRSPPTNPFPTPPPITPSAIRPSTVVSSSSSLRSTTTTTTPIIPARVTLVDRVHKQTPAGVTSELGTKAASALKRQLQDDDDDDDALDIPVTKAPRLR